MITQLQFPAVHDRTQASCTYTSTSCAPPVVQLEGRTELLQELLGGMDPNDPPFVEPPFMCDYGTNIFMGSGSYMNFGCTVLDACK